jgi:Spy/CpxP family protein refolding chaperone
MNRNSRRALVLALGAVVVLAGGFGVAKASGAGPVMRHAFGGHHGEMAHDFIAYRLGKALDQVNATDAQKQQIKAIVDAGFAKHQAMAAQHEVLCGQLEAALAGPTVDRAALETAREAALAKIDERSKEIAKSLGDIAEVLTPAQRAQLVELHRQHAAAHSD